MVYRCKQPSGKILVGASAQMGKATYGLALVE
nr:MAG TPA: protein of unknown function (DUF5122) [Caudoviricetes sp.]